MLNRNRLIMTVIIALAVASLACNATGLVGSGSTPAPIEEVTLDPGLDATEEPAELVEPTAEPTVDPAEICPQAGEDTTLYRSDEYGFCFLYPAAFEVNPSWDPGLDGGVTLTSPPLDPNAIESLISFAQVANTGPAGDLTTAELYADAWSAALFEPVFASNFERSTPTIGGQPAVELGNIPGRLAGRTAFVVANGYRYRMSIFPQPGEFENLDAAFGDVWGTLIESIVFYTPGVPQAAVRAEDVCPEATADTFLHVNQANGYCFLVPTSFEQDDTGGFNSSWFAAGDPFDTGTTIGEMRVRIVYSWFGPAQGQTAMELTEGFVADSGASRQEVIVAGEQGVEFIDPRGPVPSHTLMLVRDDEAYTLVATPYDPVRWPDAAALLDQIWDSATSSLTFFDELR